MDISHKQLISSAFHSRVDVTKYVKFKIPRYKALKVGIFRITRISFSKLEDFSEAIAIWLSKTYYGKQILNKSLTYFCIPFKCIDTIYFFLFEVLVPYI